MIKTMKHTKTFTIATLFLAACGTGPAGGGPSIALEIEGGAGQTVYFERFSRMQTMVMDSVVLDERGQGSIGLKGYPLDFYRLGMGNEELLVVADSSAGLRIEARAGHLHAPDELDGSDAAEAMGRFQLAAMIYQAERDSLRALLQEDPSNAAGIARLNEITKGFHATCKETVQKNMRSPVALAAIRRLDRNDEWELYKQVRNALRDVLPSSSVYLSYKDEVDRVEQQEIAQRLQEEELRRLQGLLPIGSEAPEIRQQTPDGGTMALSELRGKYVLLDFWASWCKPCRFENPAMKQVYDRYRAKGFEIFGVSLDRDHAAWTGAIQADGINWKHVSDLGFWSNAAALEYGVSSIPFTVLIDREGKIVAKGLRSRELDMKLSELIRS